MIRLSRYSRSIPSAAARDATQRRSAPPWPRPRAPSSVTRIVDEEVLAAGERVRPSHAGEGDEAAVREGANQLIALALLAADFGDEGRGADPVAQRRHQWKGGGDRGVGPELGKGVHAASH